MKPSVYGAAAGDLSPLLSAGFCDGSQNTTTPDYDMGTWLVLYPPLRGMTISHLIAPLMKVKRRTPPCIQARLALMLNATQQRATKLKTSGPSEGLQETSLAAQQFKSSTDAPLAVLGITGKWTQPKSDV